MTTEKKAPRRTRNRQPLASGPEAAKVAAAARPKLQVVKHDDSGLPAHARAATTPPKMDATGAFVDPSERRRRATREPRQQAPVSVGLRRCTGSKTFSIEAHDAPIADFPVQPSRKDGLGTMCKTHWREYTNALRKASLARKAEQDAAISDRPDVASGQLDGLEARRQAIAEEARKGRAKRAARPVVVDPALVAAKALVDQVNALPGPECAKRTGDDDVQAALALVAKAGGIHEAAAEA